MAIWRALETPAGKADLLALFAEAFPETSTATIERDLAAALATLLQGELIETRD